MKFVTISDTHTLHKHISLPDGDVIIHAGDITSSGKEVEVISFLNWFSNLNFKYKVMIAGNHDFFFDHSWKAYTNYGHNRHVNKNGYKEDIQNLLLKYPDITYLNDSGTTINDIKIWGSPITPWFHDWAFNREKGDDILKHWNLIPKDTDILITHGPPYKIGDMVYRNKENVGCEDLLNKIKEIQPKFHIFGHIHEGYGIYETPDFPNTKFINASSVDIYYDPINQPITFEI
jgi:Icc-related predicted phosphoesterase